MLSYVIVAGSGLAVFAMLHAMRLQDPVQSGETPFGPWPYHSDAGHATSTSQTITKYEYDTDPQYGLPIVWEYFQNGTRRKVYLHAGETMPDIPVYK